MIVSLIVISVTCVLAVVFAFIIQKWTLRDDWEYLAVIFIIWGFGILLILSQYSKI